MLVVYCEALPGGAPRNLDAMANAFAKAHKRWKAWGWHQRGHDIAVVGWYGISPECPVSAFAERPRSGETSQRRQHV